jgi:two-component system response regulator QseB
MFRILLVEDDPQLGDGIQAGLRHSGYFVEWGKTAAEAQSKMSNEVFDAVVLDIGLPGESGLVFLRRLREERLELPVIIITARDTINDRIVGLDTGADDYLVKPFDLNELTARLRALLRRSQGRGHPILKHDSISVDQATHKVFKDNVEIDLSPKEFSLLIELLEKNGRVLSKAQLEERLYGWNEEVESNAIEVHIHHLRKKLGDRLIKTVRGVGYIIEKDKN